MTTLKTALNERPATETPFSPTATVPASNVQEAIESAAASAAADLAAHVAAADPHPVYMTSAEVAAAYQPLDSDLTTIAGLSSADGNFIVGTGAGWTVESGATARASLGLGTMATETAANYLTVAAAAAGYQPLDADLTAWAAVNPSSYSTTAQIAAAYQPLDADLTSWAGVTRAAHFDTFAATPSSENLRALLSDEVGTGAAYFVGGALGTPASGTLSSCTGLPIDGGTTGTLPVARGGTGQTTEAEAVGELIQACTEDTTPDNSADFFGVYDASADTGKKVKFSTVIREKLTAARTYYVRTDGSNSNNGLANTSGGAFLTLQKAFDVICEQLDTAGYTVTVQIADGTYTGQLNLNKSWTGGGAIAYVGNTTTPANVLISTTSADCVRSNTVPLPNSVTFNGMEFRTTTAGACIFAATAGGKILLTAVRFGACAGQHIYVIDNGIVEVAGNYTISGGAVSHVEARNGGTFSSIIKTITLSGTPAFTTTAVAQNGGQIVLFGNTFSGAATGTRYSSVTQSLINTFGAGATHIPGNAAGSADAATFSLYL